MVLVSVYFLSFHYPSIQFLINWVHSIYNTCYPTYLKKVYGKRFFSIKSFRPTVFAEKQLFSISLSRRLLTHHKTNPSVWQGKDVHLKTEPWCILWKLDYVLGDFMQANIRMPHLVQVVFSLYKKTSLKWFDQDHLCMVHTRFQELIDVFFGRYNRRHPYFLGQLITKSMLKTMNECGFSNPPFDGQPAIISVCKFLLPDTGYHMVH